MAGWTAGVVAALTVLAVVVPISISAEPAEPPEPLGDTALLVAYEQSLDERWASVLASYPDAERPPIELPDDVDPATQQSDFMACLDEAGYEVTARSDGWEAEPRPGSDLRSVTIGNYVCTAEHPFAGTLENLLSIEQRDALYSYYVRFLVPCLALQGVRTPSVPDRNMFVAGSGNGPIWHPTTVLSRASSSAALMETAHRACPFEPSWRR